VPGTQKPGFPPNPLRGRKICPKTGALISLGRYQGAGVYFEIAGKQPELKRFLPPGRRSRKSFTQKIPLFPSFFDLFDAMVNFFSQVFWFKGILELKKVNADALGRYFR
jgi:hypothetical protein